MSVKLSINQNQMANLTTTSKLPSKYHLEKVDENQAINSKPDEVPLVKLKNVSVEFGLGSQATKAMKNVSLTIYKGEVLGLVGESGSGKSTTGNALMGLINRSKGEINIGDIEIKARAKEMKSKFRKQIARVAQMIFQDPTNSLNPQKTIKQIILEGLKNLNSKEIFAQEFDTLTITRLSEILRDQQQPELVQKLTVESIIKMIKEGKLEQIRDLVYVQAQTTLRQHQLPSSQLAATFLALRFDERKYFFDCSEKVSRERINTHIMNEILEAVGLSKQVLNRYPLEFSGGQQQRISISRSVVIKPSLLVADEPISALDVSIQAQVVNIFNDLKDKYNLTILFIAHDLRMVEYISDRIAIMYKGEILEIGEAAEIASNPIHPYTKSLLAAVPSIDKLNQELSQVQYDASIHKKYQHKTRNWFRINNTNHFVFGVEEEVTEWI